MRLRGADRVLACAGARVRLAIGVLALAAPLAGCVIADATLAPDGSGTLTYAFGLPPGDTPEAVRAAFDSPHLTVTSFSVDGRVARLAARFDDVTTLGSVPGFASLAVTRRRDGDAETLSLTITNPRPRPGFVDDGRDGPRITLTVPGRVLAATGPTVETSGRRVTWSMSFAEYTRAAEQTLTVRWQAVAGDAPPH